MIFARFLYFLRQYLPIILHNSDYSLFSSWSGLPSLSSVEVHDLGHAIVPKSTRLLHESSIVISTHINSYQL